MEKSKVFQGLFLFMLLLRNARRATICLFYTYRRGAIFLTRQNFKYKQDLR